jgi:MFS family permease
MRTGQRGARTAVVAAGAAVGATLLGDQMLYAVMPSRPDLWGLSSVALVGVLLSANRVVRLVSNPLAAEVFRRLGPRAPFAAALLLAVFVTAAYGWLTAFWALLAARLLWGACWSVLRLGGQWAVLDSSHDGNRGLLMGLYSGVTRVGSLSGPLLGGVLTDALGLRATLSAFAGATALAGIAWWAATPRPLRPPPAAAPAGGGFRDVLRDRTLLLVSAAGLALALVFSGLVAASIGFYFREQYGERVSLAGTALAVASFTGLTLGGLGVLNALLAPLTGHLSDRLGRARGISLALFAAAAGVAALGAGLSVWLVLAGLLIAYVASAALLVQLGAAAGDLATHGRRAAVLAAYATFQDLGAALGPLIALSFASLTALRLLFLAAALIIALFGLAFRRTPSLAPGPLPRAGHATGVDTTVT